MKRRFTNYKTSNDILIIAFIVFFCFIFLIGGILWIIQNIIIPYIWWIVYVGGAIFFIVLSLFAYFKVIKKQNIKKLEKYVTTNSAIIKKLEELNNKTNFKYIDNHICLCKTYNIKRDYVNVSPKGFFEYWIRENIKEAQQMYDDLNYNDVLYCKYKTEIFKLKNSLDFTKEKCEKVKKLNKYRKCEIKLFERKTIEYINDIHINVMVQYCSKGGRVFLSKKEMYSWDDFCINFYAVKKSRLDYEVYKRIEAVERALVTDELRFKIMKRDNYKCRICGASDKDDIRLHIDHIVPIAKGGKTEMSNLQTLCEKCNRGKSDKLM